MKKSLLQKLILLVATFSMSLSSCTTNRESSTTTSSSSTNSEIRYDDINYNDAIPDIDIKEESFEPTSIGTDDDPAQEIDVSEIGDDLLCTYADVEPTFTLKAVSKGAFFTAATLTSSNMVTIQDQRGGSLTPKIISGNDSLSFLISAEDGYTAGEGYSVSLADSAPLLFYGKDESIRKITFTVKREDANSCTVKDDIKHYSSALIISVDDVDTDRMSMILNSKIDAEKDDIICFDFDDENDDTYIKFISQELDKSGNYKVRYTNPNPDEIFTELDIHQGEQEINMEENFHLNDEETIKKSVLNSEFVEEYAAAVAYTYGFGSGWADFWKSAAVKLSFSLDDSKLNIKIVITFLHVFDETKWALLASLTIEYQRTLTVSADAKIKRVAGILPYVTMNCAAIADDTVTIKLEVVFVRSYWDKDKWIKKDPADLDWDDAKSAVSELEEELSDDEEEQSEAVGNKVIGPNLSISLGYIPISLAPTPLTLDIEVFLCMNISATIGLAAAYTWHQRQVFIEYSNSDKEESKGSSSPEVTHASSVNAVFFGKFYFEISLKLSLSLYITGFKKIFRISIDFNGGLYVSISGYGELFYNFTNNTFSMDLGANITVGLFIKVTLSVVLFNTHNIDFNLYDQKWPLVSFGDTERINSLAANKTLELSKKSTEINSTDALTFDIFDGNSFKTKIKTYKYNAKSNIISGLLIKYPRQEDVFSSISVESDYMTFEKGVLKVKDTAPREFNAQLKIKVKSLLTSTGDKEYNVPIHFLLEGSHFVTFDGDTTTKKAYAKNDAIKFPVPSEKDGYYFYGFSLDDGKTMIDMSKQFLMPDHDINITSIYAEKVYYTVTYYDGFGNLVGTEQVLNRQAAKGIDAKTRDKNMDGYTFLNWDIDLSSVTSDVSAYGIYIKAE